MARRLGIRTRGDALAEELRAKTEELEAMRVRAEEAEHIVRLTEGLTGVGFWRFAPSRGERIWSPSIFSMFGLDPAGGPPPAGGIGMFDPADQEILRSRVGGLARSADANREYGITRGDGGRAYLRMTGALERDANGAVSHMYGAIVDVTEARSRELALAESEARYRLLADSVQDVIIQFDSEGAIQFASPSARRLGYDPVDLIGKPIWLFGDQALAEAWREELVQVRAGRAFSDHTRLEIEIQQPDGGSAWVESLQTGLHDDAGNFTGGVAVLRDITERRRLEDALRSKKVEAEAAVVAKSEFLSNMSHEIRTPLTAVIGYAGLLFKIGDLPDKARTYIDRIARSGEALNTIVNNILDFSKVEAGHIMLKPEPSVLKDVFADVTGQVIELARQKGLDLILSLDPDLPDAVTVDRGRLSQVILNLLSNAIKFTNQGSVTLSVRHESTAHRLSVSVRDTGVGVAPEQVSRLFERFSQAEGSNTRRFGGVGLGLAISRGLVELMGGTIRFDSNEGVGSIFTFDVVAPAIIPDADAPQADAAESLRPLKVLVVDDLQNNRELIATLLSGASPEIVQASDGYQAVAAAARERFDIVLMDVQMPGMDGLMATRAIRETSPLNASTPVIAVSASVLSTDVEACRAAGMNDHVGKPISPRELLTKVAHWTSSDADPHTGFAA